MFMHDCVYTLHPHSWCSRHFVQVLSSDWAHSISPKVGAMKTPKNRSKRGNEETLDVLIVSSVPSHTPVQTRIHRLEIWQRDLLLQNHLVERHDEVGIKESSMEDTETDDSSDELEVVQMLRVDTTVGVDLQRVVVVGRVLE